MGIRTYDAKKVIVTVDGLAISGYADGTFITVEREQESFTKVTGADGFTGRSKSNNRSGTVTLTLMQTSPSNDVLTNLLVRDELAGNVVFPILIKDTSGESRYFAATGWVQRMPTVEYGKEISNVEWAIDVSDMQFNITGNVGVGVESET